MMMLNKNGKEDEFKPHDYSLPDFTLSHEVFLEYQAVINE
jgi:hypothetical protein